MDRNRERRTGTEQRRRAEVYLPWQEPAWDSTWDGAERRSGERRSGTDRRHPIPSPDNAVRYSDDWARGHGALNFNEWLDRNARQAPIGLPRDWLPAA